MKKYVKKPIVVEVILWDNKDETLAELQKWQSTIRRRTLLGIDRHWFNLIIPTLEGDMEAEEGDYIIKGVEGEVYPCKPGIFEKTYAETNQDFDE